MPRNNLTPQVTTKPRDGRYCSAGFGFQVDDEGQGDEQRNGQSDMGRAAFAPAQGQALTQNMAQEGLDRAVRRGRSGCAADALSTVPAGLLDSALA